MTVLLRTEIGESLRAHRQEQGRTLRDVSAAARVSLGYLSEIERGEKEASSELLASVCRALDVPLPTLLIDVAGRIRRAELAAAPVPLGGPEERPHRRLTSASPAIARATDICAPNIARTCTRSRADVGQG